MITAESIPIEVQGTVANIDLGQIKGQTKGQINLSAHLHAQIPAQNELKSNRISQFLSSIELNDVDGSKKWTY